jgi:hypothetical protein
MIVNAKLTLSLDREIIEQAKGFARSQHKSLSKLIEMYLRQVSHPEAALQNVTPLVSSLSGVIDAQKLNDHKSGYADYLENKYR